MTRVLLKILKNLIENSTCVSLMIDNDLVPFLEIESRKNFKNDDIKLDILEILNNLHSNYKVTADCRSSPTSRSTRRNSKPKC